MLHFLEGWLFYRLECCGLMVGVLPVANFAQSGLAISILTSNTLLAKCTLFIYMTLIQCVKHSTFCNVFFFYE